MIKTLEAFINSITDKSFTMDCCTECQQLRDLNAWLNFLDISLLFIILIYYNEMGKLSYPEDREILRIAFTIYEDYKKSQSSFKLFCA
jgi:hypothetical protein